MDWTASGQAQEGPLVVTIEAPHAGVVHGPVVLFEALVSDPSATTATLVSGGASYSVPVEQGRIRQQLVAVPGNNRVAVVVQHQGRTSRASRTFRYEGEPVELVFLLSWPSQGEIVDLWVRQPDDETCKWDHRQTAAGGRLLDFSADAIGFGSQAYVQTRAQAGRYRVKVHYWGASGDDDMRGNWTYDELMRQLDARISRRASESPRQQRHTDVEIRDLEARLDAWASPAAPQTPVRAELVLFPGQRAERRWRFDVTVDRTGQLLGLGEVEITEEMLVRARSEVRP